MEKTRFMAPAAPTRQGSSSAPWLQLKAPIINQYSWAQQLTGNIISSSGSQFLQALNSLLLLYDRPCSPISGGFTSHCLSSPVTEWLMSLLNRDISCAQAFVPASLHHHHTVISLWVLPTAQPCTLSRHLREKSISVPCCLGVFSFSNTHTCRLKEGRNVWHFCGDHLAEALLRFLATWPES